MYKIILILCITIFSFSCTGDKESGKLNKEELAYKLALELSGKVPQVHPDSNRVLVSTSAFTITTADVMRIIQAYLGDNLKQITNLTSEEIKTIINENATKYAEKKLILQDAEAKGITVSQGEIDTAMQKQYRKWGGEENYRQSLAKRQLSYEYILDDTHDGLVVNKYFREIVKPEIHVEEEQIKERYENYYVTVRQILLVPGDASVDSVSEVKRKLEEIRNRAIRGEDFAELVKKYSVDEKTKNRGGLITHLAHGIMPRAFVDAPFKVPVGQISDIFETYDGFHILKVLEKKPFSDSFEKAAPIIRKQLINEKQDLYYQKHVRNLREKAQYQEFLLK